MSRYFGQPIQLGIVVPDIERAIDEYLEVHGAGPFYLMSPAEMQGVSYFDQVLDISLEIALGNLGSMQIELIQPVDETPSLYNEFLKVTPTGGLQHYGYATTSFADDVDKAVAAGYTVGHRGEGSAGGAFAKLVAAGRGPGEPVAELIEMTDSRHDRFGQIASASVEWTGDRATRDYAELLG